MILATVYYFVSIFIPIVLIMSRLDELAYAQSWYMFTSGLSALFLIIGGGAMISELFPRENRKSILLFVSLIMNAIVWLIISGDYTRAYKMDILFINGVITCTGFVWGVLISTIVDAWYDEEAAVHISLDTFKKKLAYIKKQPGIIAGFVVLLIPVIFISHLVVIGFELNLSISTLSHFFAGLLYIVMLLNVSLSNYREMKKM